MKYLLLLITLSLQAYAIGQTSESRQISPNDFSGSDIQRIQQAVDSASKTGYLAVIPRYNANGTNIWKIDRPILLPSNITVLLKNCTIQLSDSCRDNMFRSNNVGIGTTVTTWNHSIKILGIGDVVLKGADNPRATGDGAKTLSLDPLNEKKWAFSYGSDAGRPDRKQTGDWRNIMILMAYVKDFKINNVTIKKSHAWAMSFERCKDVTLSDISFHNPEQQIVNGHLVKVLNRDGIDLRQGCKNFHIHNIQGMTADDFIALSALGTYDSSRPIGDLHSTMITESGWKNTEDNIEHITITNLICKTNTRAVAIRASGEAGISHVYINNVVARTEHNTILVGNKYYGVPSLSGKIRNIYAMNLMGDGESLIKIASPIANCVFKNGIYTGTAPAAVTYDLDSSRTQNLKMIGLTVTDPE